MIYSYFGNLFYILFHISVIRDSVLIT